MKPKHIMIAGGVFVLLVAIAVFSQSGNEPEDEQGMMLARAVTARQHEQIRELLARGANPNAPAGNGKTVLSMARSLGDAEAIRLLEHEAATEEKDPKHGGRGLVAHVLSQHWVILKEGETLNFGGQDRRVYEDMAFVQFTFRLKNVSTKPEHMPVFAIVAGERTRTLAEVAVEGFQEDPDPIIRLKPGEERVLRAQSVLPASLATLRKNQPLYVRFLDYDPDGKRTIPEANITLFRWKTPKIDAAPGL